MTSLTNYSLGIVTQRTKDCLSLSLSQESLWGADLRGRVRGQMCTARSPLGPQGPAGTQALGVLVAKQKTNRYRTKGSTTAPTSEDVLG